MKEDVSYRAHRPPPVWVQFFGVCVLAGLSALTHRLVAGPIAETRLDPLASMQAQVKKMGIAIVTLTDLREQLAGDRPPLLFDARPSAEFFRGHIGGAMPLTLDSFDDEFPAFAPMIGPELDVVVYCSGPLCDQALRVALRIREAGYERVGVFVEGYEAWKGASDE